MTTLPKFIRDEYSIDTIDEVNWDLLRNNLEAANRVLDNPEKFPNADFNALEKKSEELFLFLATNLQL